MIHENKIKFLKRLLLATVDKQIQWVKEEEGDWYSTNLGEREICFRFLYFEAENQIGADPMMFDLHILPGPQFRFADGTEGSDIIYEILAAAFDGWRGYLNDSANEFLDEFFPEKEDK